MLFVLGGLALMARRALPIIPLLPSAVIIVILRVRCHRCMLLRVQLSWVMMLRRGRMHR